MAHTCVIVTRAHRDDEAVEELIRHPHMRALLVSSRSAISASHTGVLDADRVVVLAQVFVIGMSIGGSAAELPAIGAGRVSSRRSDAGRRRAPDRCQLERLQPVS